jgi:hypothetical protein
MLRQKELCYYDEYRPTLQIMEIDDALQHAIDTGEPYKARLDPPPGPPANEHGNFLPLHEWKPSQPPLNWPLHIHMPEEVME